VQLKASHRPIGLSGQCEKVFSDSESVSYTSGECIARILGDGPAGVGDCVRGVGVAGHTLGDVEARKGYHAS
jgi:hypothetical protein